MYCTGTALYKPSLTSLSKYQYKTPDYTKPQPQVTLNSLLLSLFKNKLSWLY